MHTIGRRPIFALGAASALLGLARAARADTRHLRLGHNNNAQSVVHASAEAFAAAAAERSAGALRIEIFPNAVLGSEQQMLKAVSEGTLDIAYAPVGVGSAFSEMTGLIEMPYLFRDAAHAREALDGPLGRGCTEQMRKHDVVVLGWPEIGIRQMTANKPIRTAADLRGLKLRVPLSPPILETFRALGAAAETLPFNQLPEALRTGRFEAEENPINVIVDNQFSAVQSHLSLTRHAYTAFMIAVSADVFDELSPQQREALSASGPVGVATSRAWADRAEANGLAKLRASNMTVVEDIDRESFQAAMSGAQAQLTQTFGAGALTEIHALVS